MYDAYRNQLPDIDPEETQEWIEALDAAGVPCAPVQDTAQMLAHEQTQALGILQSLAGVSKPLVGLPISFDGHRPCAATAPPALGEATRQFLG